MARDVSSAFKAAVFAEYSPTDAVALVTITHPLLSAPLRISSSADECFSIDPHLRGTTSRGVQYSYIPFEMTLPEDAEDTPPAFEIRISNIARETIALLRAATDPAAVTVEIVSRDTPDLVEAEFPAFELASADYDQETVTLSVGVDALMTEAYPADSFTPAGFPGMF